MADFSKLTIDNTTYDVKDASSRNSINNLIPVNLFTSASGEDGEITLSDSSANYSYLEIYYKQQDETYSFTKVLEPNGKTISLPVFHVTNNGYAISVSARNVTINGNKITTQATNRYMTINLISTNALNGGGNTNKIYITKVLGYK